MSSHAQARLRIMKTIDGSAAASASQGLTVILDASGTSSSRLPARFLGHINDDGLKVEVTAALGPGTAVSLVGEIETPEGKVPLLGQFRVFSCVLSGIGKYQAGLMPQLAKPEPEARPQAQPVGVDFYEVLQVSRNADVDTIHRVFHLLAQRFHPDNSVTGDEGKFRQAVEAHRVLANPELRAAHDIQLLEENHVRVRIFDSLESTQGVLAEIRKRQGVLKLLYTRRMMNPHEPCLKGRDFVEMLGCPAEHLEFALWFLKENKLLQRADNNAYEITIRGVEAFEEQEQSFVKKTPLPLPAPAI
ncbi:MAG: J domain-containing protein [Bryobacteraceae bacterium]